MYAQLCKFLVEKAPNFDPPEANACTFKRLLLKKCKDEFENRVQIAAEYEKSTANNELEVRNRLFWSILSISSFTSILVSYSQLSSISSIL